MAEAKRNGAGDSEAEGNAEFYIFSTAFPSTSLGHKKHKDHHHYKVEYSRFNQEGSFLFRDWIAMSQPKKIVTDRGYPGKEISIKAYLKKTGKKTAHKQLIHREEVEDGNNQIAETQYT